MFGIITVLIAAYLIALATPFAFWPTFAIVYANVLILRLIFRR